MEPLPHLYTVTATDESSDSSGAVVLSSTGLPSLSSEPPAEFGGSGNLWSPETLLLAAVADCFVLSFRAVAAASKLEWVSVDCESTGTLDKVERVMQFTEINHKVTLRIPQDTSEETALRLLNKAEGVCLISNSLCCDVNLDATIEVVA